MKTFGLTALAGAALVTMAACSPSNPTSPGDQSSAPPLSGAGPAASSSQTVQIQPPAASGSAASKSASSKSASSSGSQVAPKGASVAHPGGPPGTPASSASKSSPGYSFHSHSHWRRHRHSSRDGERG